MKKATMRVVQIGGGHGPSAMLKVLRQLSEKDNLEISGICGGHDYGGDSKDIRDQFGIPAPGDLMSQLSALLREESVTEQGFEIGNAKEIDELLQHRMKKDGSSFSGRSVKNFLYVAFWQIHGENLTLGIEGMCRAFRARGEVMFASHTDTHLHANMSDGSILSKEDVIDSRKMGGPSIVDVYLEPEAVINPKAEEKIAMADRIIIGPGSFYGSVMGILAVKGILEALNKTKGKIIHITNLTTDRDTPKFKASDFARVLSEKIGKPLDLVMCNIDPITKVNLQAQSERSKIHHLPIFVDLEKLKKYTNAVECGNYAFQNESKIAHNQKPGWWIMTQYLKDK